MNMLFSGSFPNLYVASVQAQFTLGYRLISYPACKFKLEPFSAKFSISYIELFEDAVGSLLIIA